MRTLSLNIFIIAIFGFHLELVSKTKTPDPKPPEPKAEGGGMGGSQYAMMLMGMSENSAVQKAGGAYLAYKGAEKIKKCSGTKGKGEDCLMGIIEMMSAKAAFESAEKSDSGADDLTDDNDDNYDHCAAMQAVGMPCSCSEANSCPSNVTDTGGGPGGLTENQWTTIENIAKGTKKEFGQVLNDLKNQGIDIDFDEGTISGGPFGSGVSATSVGGPRGGGESLKSKEATSMISAIAKSKLMELSKISGGKIPMHTSNYGGGGGGSGLNFDFKSDSYDPFKDLMKKLNGKRKPSSATAAGKTKRHGGDLIGAKMDNIFDMVHRNYQRKRRRNSFVRVQ